MDVQLVPTSEHDGLAWDFLYLLRLRIRLRQVSGGTITDSKSFFFVNSLQEVSFVFRLLSNSRVLIDGHVSKCVNKRDCLLGEEEEEGTAEFGLGTGDPTKQTPGLNGGLPGCMLACRPSSRWFFPIHRRARCTDIFALASSEAPMRRLLIMLYISPPHALAGYCLWQYPLGYCMRRKVLPVSSGLEKEGTPAWFRACLLATFASLDADRDQDQQASSLMLGVMDWAILYGTCGMPLSGLGRARLQISDVVTDIRTSARFSSSPVRTWNSWFVDDDASNVLFLSVAAYLRLPVILRALVPCCLSRSWDGRSTAI
ncbi:hypothetical protein B0H34DRAFT_82953 [Crassisporium funariophilum]|nr:hypothetical protein B0H34DRAFT_82953 [Crassisporium funariophilum]